MSNFKNIYLRKLPSIGKIIEQLLEIKDSYPHIIVVKAIRQVIDDRKNSILKAQNEDQIKDTDLSIDGIIAEVKVRIKEMSIVDIRYAINATGDVLNSDLGSPLNEHAQKALINISKGYSTPSYDPCQLLAEITGAESGIIVNNNTAGILLTLNTICDGKEVIISRGEIEETKGSRLTDIIEKSGAKLISVGTTNKTHLYDYQRAISDKTGAVIKVNRSNFRIIGFVDQVPLINLVDLKEKANVPLIEIVGNGCLLDLTQLGFPEEPYVPLSIKTGSDIVCFSSDRLMGGPQSGIIVGKSSYISIMKENPLYHALKPNKLTISSLSATLKSYLDDDLLKHNITVQFLCRPIDEIKSLNKILMEKIRDKMSNSVILSLSDGYSKIGSFSIPPERFPTEFIIIRSDKLTSKEMSERLRMRDIPIIVNTDEESVSLDMRSVFPDEIDEIAKALIECFG